MIRTFLLGLALIAGLSQSATAHNYHGVLTTVDHNVTAGSMEVIHRFFAHDMEQALGQIKGEQFLLDSGDEAEAMIKALVEQHFMMDDGDDPIALNWVGMEEDGEFLYVYQEAPMAMPSPTLGVMNTMLFSAFERQINAVNVRFPGMKRSYNFSRGKEHFIFVFDNGNQDDGTSQLDPHAHKH